METVKFDSIQPRFLRYRSHQKIYFGMFILFAALILAYWGFQISTYGSVIIFKEQFTELIFSAFYFVGFLAVYYFFFHPRFKKSVQVYPSHLRIHNGKSTSDLQFSEVESIGMVYWSLFYFKLKDGTKFYFNSSLERVDYIWEGIMAARPDLLAPEVYEDFKTKLVQYDHHQKRKDWFFKYKLLDAFNWFVLPSLFLAVGYYFQSQDVVIYQKGMYFFRLSMYAMLVLLFTGFMYSLSLKKFIFDKKVSAQKEEGNEKIRDLEFEGVILQRSKVFQMITATFFFSFIISSDFNLFSVTKLKEEVSQFELKKGKTVTIDNRYNCLNCKYQLNDGDLVVFGRGFMGQVMARAGEYVGEISQDKTGRNIASDNVHEVPAGHLAVKAPNGKDIMFVKIEDVTGKIRN